MQKSHYVPILHKCTNSSFWLLFVFIVIHSSKLMLWMASAIDWGKKKDNEFYVIFFHLVAYFAKCSSSVNVNFEIIFFGSS